MTATEIGTVSIRPDRIHAEVTVVELERLMTPFIHVRRVEVDRENQDPPLALTYDEAEALAGLLLRAAVKARHVEYLTRRHKKAEWARRVAALKEGT